MSKQTINIGASPNDGTGTPLRTSFDYTNQNFTELYTAVGPSGNNIVVPGNATITGDLTVDTSTLKVDSTNNRVGIGTASPGAGYVLDVVGAARITAANGLVIDKAGAGFVDFFNSGNSGANVGTSGTGGLTIYTADGIGGSYGVRYVIDATGISTWSVSGTTAMTLNSTGLGIGVSPTYKLDVSSSSNIVGRISSSNVFNTGFNITNTTASTWSLYSFGSNDATLQNSFGIYHQNGTSFLQITQAGNVGIGVTPSAWGSGTSVIDLNTGGSAAAVSSSGTLSIANNGFFNGTDWKYKNTSTALLYQLISGTHRWFTAASGTAGTTITDFATAKMTLDASGNLLVACTSAPTGSTSGFYFDATHYAYFSRSAGETLNLNRYTSTGATAKFRYAGTEVGDISVTGAGTTYNSTSDYRLKESVAPLSGGLARVSALKPSIYKWKSDGSSGEGFLAHELAEVVPAAVTGEKDAVNEDGSIKSQSIDMSRVVPILVAAIQELTARVQTLEAR